VVLVIALRIAEAIIDVLRHALLLTIGCFAIKDHNTSKIADHTIASIKQELRVIALRVTSVVSNATELTHWCADTSFLDCPRRTDQAVPCIESKLFVIALRITDAISNGSGTAELRASCVNHFKALGTHQTVP
jgi:hypothetical protein